MKTTVEVKYQTRIMDAKTGRPVKVSPWRKNLVLDQGLNALANKTAGGLNSSAASSCSQLNIGGGTNANSFASGAITFTQSTTTVTASAGFFTAAMVGGILKYGVGSAGTEQYITAFTSATQVTVSSSATVGATVGTVWMVQQTALQTFLFATNTYQSNAGDNVVTASATSVTFQRTFINPVQGAPYTVNELGWTNTGLSILGRAVLPSSDVVGTTNFYVVVLAITFIYGPSAPTAVVNVGTGINTAGTAMIEFFSLQGIQASGLNGTNQSTLDTSNGAGILGDVFLSTAAYSQQGTVPGFSPVLAWPSILSLTNGVWTYVPASVGIAQLSITTSLTTAGQTVFGIGIGHFNGAATNPCLDVKLTTPFTLPTGTFNPSITWQATFGRTLVN